MFNFGCFRGFLPDEWLDRLMSLPPAQRHAVQEIRLRIGQPLTVSLPEGQRFPGENGLSRSPFSDVPVCSESQIRDCFSRFCEDAVYAHQDELRLGFLTAVNGVRIGIAGTAVKENGEVRSVRDVTSLCIRIPRPHRGSARGLLPFLCREDGVQSLLLVGEPASGKTTLLRDLAALLAESGKRVAVVDERRELSGCGSLGGCDVLLDYPKATGILQAIRCLAPDVVVFDELGEGSEIKAVAACANAGVSVISSLHGSAPEALEEKLLVRELICQETFRLWFFLRGRRWPGEWTMGYHPQEIGNAIDWNVVANSGGQRNGMVFCPTIESSGGLAGANGTVDGGAWTASAI